MLELYLPILIFVTIGVAIGIVALGWMLVMDWVKLEKVEISPISRKN